MSESMPNNAKKLLMNFLRNFVEGDMLRVKVFLSRDSPFLNL